ncbi:MAG: amidohydrolase family protein [Polyangia bacterium]|jgi:predicted TIM-barrel fold metal-dependent hydrolase|nr:amidohydrolase family protein [Polyangia bacterium]
MADDPRAVDLEPGVPEILDLHLHVFPPRMFEAVWRFFEGFDWAVHHEQAEDIARTLSAHGVGRATALTYPHKPGVSRGLNRFGEELAQAFPVFLPFGSVHVEDDDLDALAKEVIASPHLYGFKFQPLVQGFDVNDPRLDGLYGACQEARFPLVMHLGTAPYSNAFVGLEHFDRLMARFPRLRICVAHMGAYETEGFLERLDRHEDLWLDTTMINVETDLFDTAWKGDASRLARHADRICFGSDWPNVPYPYSEALESVGRFPLPPEARQGVLGANARRFLGL